MNLVQLLFSFQGRIRRSHWWLGQLGVAIVASIIVAIAAMAFGRGAYGAPAGFGAIIAFVVYLVHLWIWLALNLKRYHDRDKSGWWVLIILIPVVGWIWQLIELGFLDGTPGSNKYGPSPKGATGAPAHA